MSVEFRMGPAPTVGCPNITGTSRLGLYGGSFDPVHLGHLLVARAALEEFSLDRIYFIPAAQSPFKPDTRAAPGALRSRMLRLALSGMARADVDEQELLRGGTSFTIDTVRKYAARFPRARLFWLIGADHVPTLSQWRESSALARLVEFLVIPRPGAPPASASPEFNISHLKGFPLSVSSSEIRQRAALGLPLEPLVPAAVAEVIRDEHLYQGA